MTSTYKLEAGISIPKGQVGGGKSDGKPSKVARTLQVMVKGESFLIKDELEAMKAEKKMRDRNRRERLTGGTREYVSRRTPKGMRIWRVK